MRLFELWMLDHGLRLGLGISVVLGIGCTALWFTHSPLRRQRICEGSFAAVFAWIALYHAPTPAWLPTLPSFDRIVASWQSEASTAVDEIPMERSEHLLRLKTSPTALLQSAFNATPPKRNELPESFPLDRPFTPLNDIEFLPQQIQPATFSWLGAMALFFIAGAACVVACLLVGRCTLSRWIRKSTAPPDWLRDLRTEIAVNCTLTSDKPRWPVSFLSGIQANLRVSPDCGRPICFGVVRPTILLPSSMVNQGLRNELTHVLRHEMAHILHRDSLGRLLANALLPICYAHPLYWLLRYAMNESAERRADDFAARQSDPVEYVAAITQLARSFPPRPAVAFATAGILGSKSSFYRRMNMLLSSKSALERATPVWWKLSAIGIAATTLVASASALQTPKSKSELSPVEAAAAADPVAETAVAPLNALTEANVAEQARPVEKTRTTQSAVKAELLLSQKQKAEVESEVLRGLVDLVALKTRFGENHPEVIAQQKRIEALATLIQATSKRTEETRVTRAAKSKSTERHNPATVDPASGLLHEQSKQRMLQKLDALRELGGSNQENLRRLADLESEFSRLNASGESLQKELQLRQEKSAESPRRYESPREVSRSDSALAKTNEAARLQELLSLQNSRYKQSQSQLLALEDELARRSNQTRELVPGLQASTARIAGVHNLPSIAMLKHEQRMATANLDILRTEIEMQQGEVSVAKILVDRKQMSADQFRVKTAGLKNAEARLRKAMLEIESLGIAINEAEAEWQRFDAVKSKTPSK